MARPDKDDYAGNSDSAGLDIGSHRSTTHHSRFEVFTPPLFLLLLPLHGASVILQCIVFPISIEFFIVALFIVIWRCDQQMAREEAPPNEHYCPTCQRMVPHREWAEHSRHYLRSSRWQDLLRYTDSEESQELEIAGRMEHARMEESTKRAEKQQIAAAVVKIYLRLRAEANEEELLQLTAAAAPRLSPPLVRCLVETARLVNHKIDDEYQ